jgi:acyl-homoserine-lactone acylase
MRRDFVENSNDSYWLANPSRPVTGFPRTFGDTGARWSKEFLDQQYDLRTRSAPTMVMRRIDGADGLGPPGFTFADMKNLMYSDIQYGATLVKPQLVAMCRSFPGGLAPTGGGRTIPAGDSRNVLAAWNDRENPRSRGAVLFAAFWENALERPPGDPWSHPFRAADPVRRLGDFLARVEGPAFGQRGAGRRAPGAGQRCPQWALERGRQRLSPGLTLP